jgi:hypothetical protein
LDPAFDGANSFSSAGKRIAVQRYLGGGLMKIVALYNAEGHILAAVVDDDHHKGPKLRPVPPPGATLGTFEVPEPARKHTLSEICANHKIDVGGKRLVAKDAK